MSLGTRSSCHRYSVSRSVKIRRHSRNRQHFNTLGACAFEGPREFAYSRSSSVYVVHKDDASSHFVAHLER